MSDRRLWQVPGTTVEACRACGTAGLEPVVSFGDTPIADRLLRRDELDCPDESAPLDLVLCLDCGLLQIAQTLDPGLLFAQDYPYFSSVSSTLLDHSADHARQLIVTRQLSSESLVVELASNDGYMLRNFVERGIPCLGIDPARAPSDAARAMGVPTRTEFFTYEVALAMRDRGEVADVVIANNVLAHVADLHGFIAGVATILKPDGVAVFEVPHALELVRKCAFDTIYHQHLCYFSVSALIPLFERHGLHVNDVHQVPVHGGSLRVSVGSRPAPHPRVAALTELETVAGLGQVETLARFRDRVELIRTKLSTLLQLRRQQGARIAMYGAAGKSATLLSHCGIDGSLIDYVVDRNPYKHGRFLPGNRLEVYPASRLQEEVPEFCLLVVWNFADEILEQQSAYRQAGGRFIVPIPEVAEL